MSNEPLCASCGRAGLRVHEVTRSFGSGAALLVIEGIPVYSCPHCGESYFTAHALREIERIKSMRKSLAAKRPVAVVAFQAHVA